MPAAPGPCLATRATPPPPPHLVLLQRVLQQRLGLAWRVGGGAAPRLALEQRKVLQHLRGARRQRSLSGRRMASRGSCLRSLGFRSAAAMHRGSRAPQAAPAQAAGLAHL